MIKLDVQGSEIDILKGLGNEINLFEVIILETSVKEYNKGSPLFLDVINFMNEKNYSFYDDNVTISIISSSIYCC
jgi:hypothetical protein